MVTETRNKSADFFQKQNHVKVAKSNLTKSQVIYDNVGITTLSMSGLNTNPPNDAATPGDHASITVGFPSGVTSWTSEAWGVGTYGDTTYGTGSSPTDYSASEGQTLLWEGVGDDGNTYRASAPIRSDVVTMDSTSITLDSTNRTFDEAA